MGGQTCISLKHILNLPGRIYELSDFFAHDRVVNLVLNSFDILLKGLNLLTQRAREHPTQFNSCQINNQFRQLIGNGALTVEVNSAHQKAEP
jgi:hypothetical protein